VQGVPQLVLVDLWRARAQAPAVKAKMWELYRLHKPEFFGIEKAHYGMAYCQELRTEGMMVRELMPDKDKLSRARAASVAFENNRVWFPERAGQMLLDLEHELLTFPDGAHDDQVDVVSYACGILRDGIASQGYGYDVRHGGGVQDPFDDH
jgi:predicted phage terminase large subunit-like protein